MYLRQEIEYLSSKTKKRQEQCTPQSTAFVVLGMMSDNDPSKAHATRAELSAMASTAESMATTMQKTANQG